MIAKLKWKFIHVGNELDLPKKMQGLKQVRRSIQVYNKEFYGFLIRINHVETDKEKVIHYLNGLRPSIQEELNLIWIINIEEVYQFSLRVKENLNKKFWKQK